MIFLPYNGYGTIEFGWEWFVLLLFFSPNTQIYCCFQILKGTVITHKLALHIFRFIYIVLAGLFCISNSF